MKFLIYDYLLLVCVKFRTFEGEEIFFRFFQLGSLRSEEILKRIKSKWISNAESPIPFKPTTLYRPVTLPVCLYYATGIFIWILGAL